MIELINVSKTYDDLLFENINIKIPDRGLTFIYGKSGCGKSTLLNLIAGLDDNYHGKIFIDGECYSSNLDRANIRYSTVSYMNQKDDLIQEMTIMQNMNWFKSLSSSSYDIHSFFKKFHLNNIENNYPSEISGGELSLICLLKNILLNRKYLLLDEPTAKLDEMRKKLLNSFLKDLSKNYSIIIVSHDLDFIETADILLHFEHKKVILEHNDNIKEEKSSLNKSMTFHYKKLCSTNLKFYRRKYIFSIFIFVLVICYCYTFFKIGTTLSTQIEAIINENGELEHIQAVSSKISYEMIVKVKNEPFIEKLDYSFNFLYPSMNRNDLFIKHKGKEYYFSDYPISFGYNVNDNLKENEIIISSSLANSFQLKKGDQISLYVYCNVTSTWDEKNELYQPKFEQINYNASIKDIVDQNNYKIYISNLKANEIIQKYIGYNNSKLVTNQLDIYLKPNTHFSEVKDVMMKRYGLECTDLIKMSKDMLEFNSSTYDILRVYGYISGMAGIIYILTSLLSFNRYETKQRKSLELLGIKRSKILKLQWYQNLIPLIIAFVISCGMLYFCIPKLNQYFYQQKLFYSPFLPLSSFINYDFSQISILFFDFKFIVLICLILAVIIMLYKLFIFIHYSKSISGKNR